MSRAPSRLRSALDSDFVYAFSRAPVAIASFVVVVLLVGAAILAPLIAPQNPFDPARTL